jgi:hypothetical protein
MELPKCKICGDRHRLGPCPSTQLKIGPKRVERLQEVISSATATDKAVSAAPRVAGTGSAGDGGSIPSRSTTKRAPRGTFDRNAYMREYMRKRRQKESKT